MEKRPHPRTFRPGMRVAVLLPDGEMKEIPQERIRLITVGGRVPDQLPLTGYPVTIL